MSTGSRSYDMDTQLAGQFQRLLDEIVKFRFKFGFTARLHLSSSYYGHRMFHLMPHVNRPCFSGSGPVP